jgi:hypothetical protein
MARTRGGMSWIAGGGRHAAVCRPVGQAVFQPFEIKNQRNLEKFRVSARAGALV